MKVKMTQSFQLLCPRETPGGPDAGNMGSLHQSLPEMGKLVFMTQE